MLSSFGQAKPIFISLSSNVEKDDIKLVLKLIFQPWKWKDKDTVEKLEEELRKFLGAKHAFAFNSGRSAFLAILRALEIKKGREVLLQAFTCNAAVNPILWAGLKPVFVDIEEKTLNINLADLERKITEKSRAVMVQHTFGMPADLDKILEICKKYNLILIEDCAHCLGGKFKEKKLGTFGKASFFSFGRDKIISSVFGGIVITNDDKLAEKIEEFRKFLSLPSYFWIFQQLLYPILTKYFVLPSFRLNSVFGKILLLSFQKLKILSKAVLDKEKKGERPEYIPQKMPKALAKLAENQFKKLERFNNHRKKIAKIYFICQKKIKIIYI
jgi:dTDP-4-amino-4,6-dideoxygalactose transaminase